MFKKEMVTSMEKVFVVFRPMQQENHVFCDFVVHLQKCSSINVIGMCSHDIIPSRGGAN